MKSFDIRNLGLALLVAAALATAGCAGTRDNAQADAAAQPAPAKRASMDTPF
jgi:hypothetical protein